MVAEVDQQVFAHHQHVESEVEEEHCEDRQRAGESENVVYISAISSISDGCRHPTCAPSVHLVPSPFQRRNHSHLDGTDRADHVRGYDSSPGWAGFVKSKENHWDNRFLEAKLSSRREELEGGAWAVLANGGSEVSASGMMASGVYMGAIWKAYVQENARDFDLGEEENESHGPEAPTSCHYLELRSRILRPEDPVRSDRLKLTSKNL